MVMCTYGRFFSFLISLSKEKCAFKRAHAPAARLIEADLICCFRLQGIEKAHSITIHHSHSAHQKKRSYLTCQVYSSYQFTYTLIQKGDNGKSTRSIFHSFFHMSLFVTNRERLDFLSRSFSRHAY